MDVVSGNLLEIEEGIICHQVNCQGVMGAGVAKAIASRYPQVLSAYRELCDTPTPWQLLGQIQDVRASSTLTVINLFGQESYSRSRRATSYDAVDIAWKQIGAIWADDKIHVPHSMGCGLGGGIWSIYSAIVDAHHPDVVAVWLTDGPNSQPAVV